MAFGRISKERNSKKYKNGVKYYPYGRMGQYYNKCTTQYKMGGGVPDNTSSVVILDNGNIRRKFTFENLQGPTYSENSNELMGIGKLDFLQCRE